MSGRYIDADAYIEKYECCGYLDEISVEKFNEITPTANVRPNVHGEWISMKTNVYPACYTIRCSVCNFIAFYSGTEDNNKDCGYNFCPNCGADMRKGETNG